jgi:triacylglycerol lipase
MNLVFASGFLLPQSIFGRELYFRGVAARVTPPHQALFPPVSTLASSEARAEELAGQMNARFPDGPIHIIAHSMAGLDSRHLIAANLHGLSSQGRIISLTTLATPHRGSPIADLVVGPGRLHGLAFTQLERAIEHAGINFGAIRDLTSESTRAIPDVRETHRHIRYRSYAATGRPGFLSTSALLLPLHTIISLTKHQRSDGVVTPESAAYGEIQEPWLCDHLDMVGHDLNLPLGPSTFPHLAEFDKIIDKLERP